MKRLPVIIIGAGQCGLAMSRCLGARGIDHLLLERGQVANSWRTERWESLRLLTPNWQSRLPGFAYAGPHPDGFMSMPEVIRLLDRYAVAGNAPIHTGTRVLRVSRDADGYRIRTDRGDFACSCLVLATGACNIANVPAAAAHLPAAIRSLTPSEYKRPSDLPEGGVLVVGGSATGVQLAWELQRSGRPVILSVGEHIRVPRTYRGRDIKWWMDRIGLMDQRHDEVDDLGRVRRAPSLQLVGSAERRMLDLNALMDAGVRIVGRLAGLRDGRVQFSGALANHCALADLKMNRLLDAIDDWAESAPIVGPLPPPERFRPTTVPAASPLGLDLAGGEVRSVLWATGYRPDYAWLDVPVLDRKGRLRHDGGVAQAPGLFAMGLPFMRRRKSTLLDGAGDDARDLLPHLVAHLDRGSRPTILTPAA